MDRFLSGTVEPERADVRLQLLENGARANPNANYLYQISPELQLTLRYTVPVRQFGRYKGLLDYEGINVEDITITYLLNGEVCMDRAVVLRFLTGEWTDIQQYLDHQDEDFKKSKLFKRGGWD